MFGKRFGKSSSQRDQTSILYSFDNFHLYVDFLARQHNAHFKIASITDMMKIVNGIEDDIPEVLYLENHQFEASDHDAIKPLDSHCDRNADDPDHFELVDDDESELKINFEQEEPFILVKKSKSLPTLVMPTKFINELQEHSLFKKAAPQSDSIDTDFEVLGDKQPPTSTD